MLEEIARRAVEDDSPSWREYVAGHRNTAMRLVCITVLCNVVTQMRLLGRAPIVERIIRAMLQLCSPLDPESVSVVLHIVSQEVVHFHESKGALRGVFAACIVRSVAMLVGEVPQDLVPAGVSRLIKARLAADGSSDGDDKNNGDDDDGGEESDHCAEPMRAMVQQLQQVREAATTQEFAHRLRTLTMMVMSGEECLQSVEQLDWMPVLQRLFSDGDAATTSRTTDVGTLGHVVDFLTLIAKEATICHVQVSALVDMAKHLVIHQLRSDADVAAAAVVGAASSFTQTMDARLDGEPHAPDLEDVTLLALRRKSLRFIDALLERLSLDHKDLLVTLVVECRLIDTLLPFYKQRRHDGIRELALRCICRLTHDRVLWMAIESMTQQQQKRDDDVGITHNGPDNSSCDPGHGSWGTHDGAILELVNSLSEHVEEDRQALSWSSSSQLYALAVMCLCNVATLMHSVHGSVAWSRGVSRKRMLRLVHAEHELLRCCGLHLLAKSIVEEEGLRMLMEQYGEDVVKMALDTAVDVSQSYTVRERAMSVLCSVVGTAPCQDMQTTDQLSGDRDSEKMAAADPSCSPALAAVSSRMQDLWDCGCERRAPVGFLHVFASLMLSLLCQQGSYSLLDHIIPPIEPTTAASAAATAAIGPRALAFKQLLDNMLLILQDRQTDDEQVTHYVVTLLHAILWRLVETKQDHAVLHRVLSPGRDNGRDGPQPFVTRLIESIACRIEGSPSPLHLSMCRLLQCAMESLESASLLDDEWCQIFDRHVVRDQVIDVDDDDDSMEEDGEDIEGGKILPEFLCERLFSLYRHAFNSNSYFAEEGPSMDFCLLATNTLSSLMAVSSTAREHAVRMGLVDECIEKMSDLAAILHIEQFKRGAAPRTEPSSLEAKKAMSRTRHCVVYILAQMRLLRNTMLNCARAQRRAVATGHLMDRVRQMWSVASIPFGSSSNTTTTTNATHSLSNEFREEVLLLLLSAVAGCDEAKTSLLSCSNLMHELFTLSLDVTCSVRIHAIVCRILTCMSLSVEGCTAMLRANYVGLSLDALAKLRKLCNNKEDCVSGHNVKRLRALMQVVVGLSFSNDAQMAIMRTRHVLDKLQQLMCSEFGDTITRTRCSLIVRNLCFLRANKNHFMSRQDITRTLLDTVLDPNDDMQVRSYAASALWALAHNNQRGRHLLRPYLPRLKQVEHDLAVEFRTVHGYTESRGRRVDGVSKRTQASDSEDGTGEVDIVLQSRVMQEWVQEVMKEQNIRLELRCETMPTSSRSPLAAWTMSLWVAVHHVVRLVT